MKSILFTNVGFKNFAGSEIATLTLANYYLRNGYTVDVFTLEYDYPIKKYVNKKINIITLETIDNLKENYDFIWSHHFPLLNYILFSKKIKGKKIYFESLSYKLPIEAFPIYYNQLSLTGVVSEKVKRALMEKGFDTSNSYILPNYATKECFDVEYNKRQSLNKIAIVSNHLPNELEEFAKLARKSNIIVDIYGFNHKIEYITPELLADYDLVISLGKTVFFALAIGIPCYTYDENVSEGYITKENIELNLKNNFANNIGYSAKNPNEIYDDIINNYVHILAQTEEIKEFAKNNFFMDTLMNEFENKIRDAKEIDYGKLYREFPTLEYTSQLYVEDLAFAKSEIMRWYNKSLELGELYQEEIKKSIAYHKQLQQTNTELLITTKELKDVLNSKGWKFLEKLRRLKRK